MDSQDRSLVIILLITALTLFISGRFFALFVVHCWTSIGDLTAGKDTFLAATLAAYFVIFGMIGVALGVLVDNYSGRFLRRAGELTRSRR